MTTKAPISFETADFTKRDDIIRLFPVYKQLQLAARKPLPKNVNIEYFTLKTPYGDTVLLDSTSLVLESNRRQCLYGPNSSGKTLLFSSMSTGEIKDFPKHINVHHCKELENHELSETVLNTIINSHPYRSILVKLEAKLRELLASNPSEATAAVLKENLDYVVFQMNSISGYQAEEKVIKMLRVLGFDEVGQNKLVSSLSGGLRMRVALCMAFFIEADLLLLDEPTNHLDFPSVLWLENRLRGYKGSFLLVSHDRELLNNVCTSVLLIEDKQIKYYACGFSEFEKKKAVEDKKKYEEIAKFLKKNQNPNPSSLLGRQVLDRRAWYNEYHAKQTAMQCKFSFPKSVPLTTTETTVVDGKEVPISQDDISLINLKDVRFSYDVKTGHFIFNSPISFNVLHKTRVGVMGPNGAGKSTFLKLLTHKLTPVDGTVADHPNFTLAYFGQHSTAELNLENTAMEFMISQFPKANTGSIRNHLTKTGIIGTAADTRMKGLSFSQRSCIIFAKLTYVCPHLLIMDEPTNFLDLESVDSLISACNKYQGALLLVSHNRDFLKKCARQYLSIVPGRFELYDTLKVAERATYTFIEEMESGNKITAKDAIVNNPGGGTIHSSQKVETASAPASASPSPAATSAPLEEKKQEAEIVKKNEEGDKREESPADKDKLTVTSTSSPTSPAPAVAAEETVSFTVGEKVSALWTDGKWYPGIVKSFNDKLGKYSVTYTGYGNTASLPLSSMKKLAVANPGPQNGNKKNQSNDRHYAHKPTTAAGGNPRRDVNRR